MNSPLTRGAIFCLLSVALGAMGAHALKEILEPAQLTSFETGVRYQFLHGLALIGLYFLPWTEHKALRRINNLMTIGTALFSWSIFLLVTGLKFLGPVTPIGGTVLMISWILLIIWSIKNKKTA